MVAKHIGAIVLLNAKLVILTTVVTKRPLVFHLTQLAHLITLIVLLNVPLGVVIQVIQSLVIVVWLLLLVLVGVLILNLQITLKVLMTLYIMVLVHSILVMEQPMNGMLMSDLLLNPLATFLTIAVTTALTIK